MALFWNTNNCEIPKENLWYQKGGALSILVLGVRRNVDDAFPNEWIGRRGTIEWPPRSPDINTLEFFFGGNVKNVI